MTASLNEDHKNFLYLDHLNNLIIKIIKKENHEFDKDFEKLLKMLEALGENYQRDTGKGYFKQYQQIKSKARKKCRKKGISFLISFL